MAQQDTTHHSLSAPRDTLKDSDFVLHGPAKKIAAHWSCVGFVAGVVVSLIVFFHTEKRANTTPVPGPAGDVTPIPAPLAPYPAEE